MIVTITPAKLHGRVRAVASKSAAHRQLLCAAFSDRPTEILCGELSEDILATAGALSALGAAISHDREAGAFRVCPVPRQEISGEPDVPERCVLDAGESGSTLRFLLPVVCALGVRAHIVTHGALAGRPLSPLREELERHGCRIERNPDGSLDTDGKLAGGEFRMAADVSSQFVSGMLFALPHLGEPSSIRLEGRIESEGYIRMTIRALEDFGIRTERTENVLRVFGRLCSPGRIRTEGDWSNAAFWEIADMLSGKDAGGLVCTGLNASSAQGDRAVRQLKTRIAAGGAVIDAGNVPDLVPVLSVLAAVSPGDTVFTHAQRLRLKESDRLETTVRMLRGLGGDAEETDDGIVVHGKSALSGGSVDSCRDHRIAMSAAVASIACRDRVVITGAEAVGKSYPAFWDDFEALGGIISREVRPAEEGR